ncbi:hypothetical protein ABVF61_30815 [Roseibium sp. HPY-6]|uniref:hypothetical protein n=1 Tax=Roseibium sp. HPY-6 TaxID=3229852 RepID=UPI0033907148
MRSIKKIASSALTATFVSGALIGNAFAEFPDQTFGDGNGNQPVSIQQMKIANAKALRAAGRLSVSKNTVNHSAFADFPDQTVGDLNGANPVPVRKVFADTEQPNVPISQFEGDWNGTSRVGFPRQ